MGVVYGYARVSSGSQSLEIQEQALRDAGCTVVRSEKVSGRSRENRDELQTLLVFMQPGDVLTVCKLDRLGRSMKDLADIAHELDEKGVDLKVLDQPVDTTTTAGRAFFGMLTVFAQFENDIRRERQMAGIEAAKAKGDVYKGRPCSIDRDQVRELKHSGMRPVDIARKLEIGRASVYRVLAEQA
ncbi:MAG: recombinase family protein [Pseudomonadota bacterium]